MMTSNHTSGEGSNHVCSAAWRLTRRLSLIAQPLRALEKQQLAAAQYAGQRHRDVELFSRVARG
jgi:hypothetical protein